MANEFDNLFAARKQGKSTQPPTSDANKARKTQKTKTASKATPPPAPEPTPTPPAVPAAEPEPSTAMAKPLPRRIAPEPAAAPKKKKRGRPATGKRSDDGWIGRTYYIQEKTDIDIAEELVALRRQGVSLDKSELVDALLSTWVSWRKGEDANNRFGEFSPRRKDD